jgi:hypothetical protein
MSRTSNQEPLAAPPPRNFLLVKTDLFLSNQREENIGKWFLGGDCAGWFYMRLLTHVQIQHSCEPVMEDWGWTLSVGVEGARVAVDVWDFFEIENCWLLGVTPKSRLFWRYSADTMLRAKDVVSSALESIVKGEPRISKHQWFAETPFDLGIKQF